MAACPLCTATVPDGAERCASCGVPFQQSAGGSRQMIPPPPPSSAVRQEPLAARLPAQPPPPPPPDRSEPPPWTAAPLSTSAGPVPTDGPWAMGTASGTVTGLTPVVPETAPRWRDPRVLIGAPVAVVVLLVGWLLLTTGDAERQTVVVPDVVGRDLLDAKNLLERQGFVVPLAGLGTVTTQDPPAGEEAAPGSAVVLQVEPYPEPAPTAVPPSAPAVTPTG